MKTVNKSEPDTNEAKAYHLMPKESPVVKYQTLWARKDRIKKRWERGVVRAKEIPSETLQHMNAFHTEFGMSYEKIGQMYGLSRYLVLTALTKYYHSDHGSAEETS